MQLGGIIGWKRKKSLITKERKNENTKTRKRSSTTNPK
jgi:hypothetical protein